MDNEVEVMRIIRVPPMGKMVVKAGDNRYQHISQVHDDALRQRILAAIGELVTFADGYSALEDAGVAPLLSVQLDGEDEDKLEQRQQEFLESLEIERDVMYVEDVKGSSNIHPVGTQETDRGGDTGLLSVAEMINPILQKHVDSDPQLAGRTIKLESEAHGGLHIVVDGKVFQRPEEIPDNNVRKVLRAALKEWDNS